MPLFGITVDPTTDIPTKSSELSAWIEWHKELASRYGLQVANELFMKAWQLRQPDSWYSGLDTINRGALIQYLKTQGVSIDENGIDLASDFVYSVADKIGGIFTFGKVTLYVLLGIVALFLVIFLFNVAKNPNAAIAAGTKAAM